MDFNEVVRKRKSKRWYTDREVPENLIKKILEDAGQSPSFMNNQPWEVAVVTGKKLTGAAELLEKMQSDNRSTQSISWDINWPERQKNILAVMKESKGKRIIPDDPMGKWMYNAPAALFVHIHESLNEWAILDTGLFVQTLLLSATDHGLGTVPQAKLGMNNRELALLLGLPSERRIIMGLSMGYADEDHPNNQFLSPREDPGEWTSWHS